MKWHDVTSAWRHLDRSRFLPEEARQLADYDGPLPIGWNQTISQPSLVCEMTRILRPGPENRVLEIGTGSGYQTALLAELSGEVHTVERIEELSRQARHRLEEMGYANIRFHVGDGTLGWPDAQPYDRIMVTAAAGTLPQTLVDQLGRNGRMVIPVGPPYAQDLTLVERSARGDVRVTPLLKVSFVELVGDSGWQKEP